jgi:malate/lactate dehydrogenase
LQKGDSWSVVNDTKGGSEVLLKLTEKGRDEIIDLFYDGKEKRELKRLVKRLELQLKKGKKYADTKISTGTPKKRTES